MTDAAKAAIRDLSALLERAESAGARWRIDERLESAEWKGDNKVQDTPDLMGAVARRVSFVIDVPLDQFAWGWDDAPPHGASPTTVPADAGNSAA